MVHFLWPTIKKGLRRNQNQLTHFFNIHIRKRLKIILISKIFSKLFHPSAIKITIMSSSSWVTPDTNNQNHPCHSKSNTNNFTLSTNKSKKERKKHTQFPHICIKQNVKSKSYRLFVPCTFKIVFQQQQRQCL